MPMFTIKQTATVPLKPLSYDIKATVLIWRDGLENGIKKDMVIPTLDVI